MAKRKAVEKLWREHESGIVIPDGFASDTSFDSSETYLAVKEKALEIERLYADNGVPLTATSDLAGLISDAKLLSDSWLMGQAEKHPMTLLFRTGLLDRIADTLLLLSDVPDRAQFLEMVTSGSLNLLARTRSKAKDTLWELELWAILRRRSFAATLKEPPDIVVSFAESQIGIACKKIYSEKHVQNVLSQAVGQIESAFDIGIVAINIDDLVPADQILRTPTHETLSQYVSDLNKRFLTTHERHFRKYLASGRVISAIVSTSVLADVFQAQPRFNHARQSTVWTIPGLPAEKDRQLRNFYELLMA